MRWKGWMAAGWSLLGLWGAPGVRAQGDVEYGGAGGAWASGAESGSEGVATRPPHGAERPETHRVRPGETLWSLSERYFGDAEQWPRLWSFNPEITNPHWIYPDDVIRLRAGAAKAAASASASTRAPRIARRRTRPPRSVYLREMGWLDRDAVSEGGRIEGSPTDRALLAPHDPVYVSFEEAGRLEPGLNLTVYERVPQEERMAGESGELVRILGSIHIERVDRERRIARGVVTESVDPIERGMPVARIDRRFEWVAPVPADRNLESRVVATLRPRHMVGSYQVVFVPVGAEAGIRKGFRFHIVRRGDEWLRTYRDVNVRPGVLPRAGQRVLEGREEDYPDEMLGYGLVVGVRPRSATVVVVGARREIQVGDRVLLRRGH